MFTEDGILMMVLFVCCTAGNERMGDEGAIRIAEGLEKNTSLKELDLDGVFPPHLLLHHVVLSH